MPRKDVRQASGFLDLTMTLSAKKKIAKVPNHGFSFLFHWESALTGCTPTADRTFAAGLVEKPNCRFCDAPKESLQHFVDECTQLPDEIAQPFSTTNFGPNFEILGIAEVPLENIRRKLTVSKTSDIHVMAWQEPLAGIKHVWTDGSVQLNHYPWLTLAAYSVIAENEDVLAVGSVQHWRLSSYTAELWAILIAFATATQPLVVHTDSLTIVQQFAALQQQDSVQVSWTHANWWGFLLNLIQHRRGFVASPLQLLWCPAHLLEHILSDAISEADAIAVGSTRQDIRLNRLADTQAKSHIHQLAVNIRADLTVQEQDVFARQLWLSKLNRICKKPEDVVPSRASPPSDNMPTFSPRELCPKWSWDANVSHFPWTNEVDIDVPFRENKTLSEHNFRLFLSFSNTLCWRLGEKRACSVFELAVYAFTQGWRFRLPSGVLSTPQAYACIIRASISYCKNKQIVVAPLLLDKRNKSNGRTFPKGAFLGAEAYLDNATLEMLCRAFMRGAKETPLSWCIPFDALL